MKSCLVVDDSKVIRMVSRKILEDFNFRVQEAEDGQEALKLCRENMPDAILLDWNMPIMSGIDFLKEFNKSEADHKPIVIFCTVENDVSHIEQAIAAGANEYIMKPFDSEIVQSKFSQVGLI